MHCIVPVDRSAVDRRLYQRKHGRRKIEYELSVEDRLEETYGVIVYQEQVMQIANIWRVTHGEADPSRAMGKRKRRWRNSARNS
jgi:DNA polymerase III alpha subunit